MTATGVEEGNTLEAEGLLDREAKNDVLDTDKMNAEDDEDTLEGTNTLDACVLDAAVEEMALETAEAEARVKLVEVVVPELVWETAWEDDFVLQLPKAL